jgi:hypothetical protein
LDIFKKNEIKKIELYFYNSDERYTHTQTLQMNQTEDCNERGLIVGLKTNVVKFRNESKKMSDGLAYTKCHLLDSWKMLYNAGIRTELTTMIWNYVDKTEGNSWCMSPRGWPSPDACRIEMVGSSKSIGKKTIIADYVNKRGKIHKAHYSYRVHKNCYRGPVSQLGDEPIYFNIDVVVTKTNAMLFIDRLSNVNIHNIEQLFELIDSEGPTGPEEEEEELCFKVKCVKPKVQEKKTKQPLVIDEEEEEEEEICFYKK